MADIYSTYALNRVVVPALRPMPKFFTSMFPETVLSDKEEIYVDYAKSGYPRVTPFVHPLAKARTVDSIGYATKVLRPAYLKDLRCHYPHKYQKRLAGEMLGGEMTMEQRMIAALTSDMQDQLDMLSNRLEVMAAEAVIHGTQTVRGEGFSDLVDFQRDPSTKIVLSGADAWDLPASPTKDEALAFIAKVTTQLEGWAETQRDAIGSTPDIVLMDRKAWDILRRAMASCHGDNWLDTENRGYERISTDLTPSMANEIGLSAKGTYGDFSIFTYQCEYQDPETNALARVVPDYSVIMISRSALMGVRHFGAIQDLENLRPAQYFSKSWIEEDPSTRMLLMQSAPLMVPYRPNAVLTIKVKA